MARAAKASARSKSSGGKLAFRRVVVKLTGESLAPVGTTGLNLESIQNVTEKIVSAHRAGAEIAVVVGAGNWLRGASLAGAAEVIRPVAAHQMGMTATVINGLALSEALTSKGCEVLLTCAMPAGAFTELYCPQKARKAMSQGQIVVLTGGTGNSFVTTDTCAAIRAADLGVDGLLKATKVDGVYDSDPKKNPNAKRFAALGYQDMIDRRLGVMDLPAVLICQQAKVPIVVFDFQTVDSVARIVTGKAKGSVVN